MREKVVCSGAEAGELYMLYAYVGDMDFKYIDQSVADAGGSVTFNYYPMDCDEELTVKVVGTSGAVRIFHCSERRLY